MSQSVQRFFAEQTELFIAGDFGSFAAMHTFPSKVGFDGQEHRFENATDLEVAAARFREQLFQTGLMHFTPRVDAVELPRNGRFRVWLSWSFLGESGLPAAGGRSLCVLQNDKGTLRVESCVYECGAVREIPDLDRKHRLA